MNTPETSAVIAALCVIGLAVLAAVGAAKEWWAFSWSASLKVIPAAKRQPTRAVEVVQVVPGTVEQGGEVKTIASKRGTG